MIKCVCSANIITNNLNKGDLSNGDIKELLNIETLKKWFTNNRDAVLVALTNRNRDRLLLPRIDARIANLAQQLRQFEKKYKLPHQRVSARDLSAFGIKYPLENRIHDCQFTEPRHIIIKNINDAPLPSKTQTDVSLPKETEFVEINHSYEPKMYDVRFHLEREIDIEIWHYNWIDRRDYYWEFRYDLRRLLPKKFPARDHLHCLLELFSE